MSILALGDCCVPGSILGMEKGIGYVLPSRHKTSTGPSGLVTGTMYSPDLEVAGFLSVWYCIWGNN